MGSVVRCRYRYGTEVDPGRRNVTRCILLIPSTVFRRCLKVRVDIKDVDGGEIKLRWGKLL
jgi:hypothetical protein